MKLPPTLWLAAACLAAATRLSAADKLDLKRITPVPADQPIPIQDFFRTPLLYFPILNLSGSHIAAIVTDDKDKTALLVLDRTTGKFNTLSAPGERDVYNLFWLDDKRLLTRLSVYKLYGEGLFAQDVGKLSSGYPLIQLSATQLIGIPRKDRTHPLIWIGAGLEDGAGTMGVARVDTNLDTGMLMRVVRGSVDGEMWDKAREHNRRHITKLYPQPKDVASAGYNADYICDKDGELAFCYVGKNGFHKLYRYTNEKWEACPIDFDQYDYVDVGDEPGQIVVRPLERTGKPLPLRFMNAATGELGQVLMQDKGYDVSPAVYRDRLTGDIVGLQFSRSGPQTVWFDAHYKEAQKLLEASFPGLVVRILDNNEAANLFLVATFSDRQPTIYQWVDTSKHTAGLIKNSQPWIDPKRMQPMNVMKFKTRDGLSFDAYVTLPAGATKENPPPLVVLCHGGPWARDNWGYNGEVQFLASRGYAVLQPNYRGSTGSDWQYPETDRYEFLKMHNDVSDAVTTLVKSGLVDAKRVGIMGASFGAYLALSGVVHENALYRCAVMNAGVFDWELQINEYKYDQYSTDTFSYLKRKLGDPKTQKEKFHDISPVNFVSQLHVPVLVAHGKDDPIAPVSQSRKLVSELERYKVPHEAYFTADEVHGMAQLDDQVELYGRIEAFLAKNLMNAK